MKHNKKALVLLLLGTIILLFWLVLFITGTKFQNINYWWQACLSFVTILGGLFGIMVAKHWNLFKSGVGRGIAFISLGLVSWGIAQGGWTYYNLKGIESPDSLFVNTVYIISIPLWFYGIAQLSRATGAKFGWRGLKPKVITLVSITALSLLSYYLLVVVDRGGLATFHRSFDDILFDLGYAFGDLVIVSTALTIFGLSWNYLGGRFKKPIVLILGSFVCQYVADMTFSYYDYKGQYYNGHWIDLLYLIALVGMGLGVCLLDPTKKLQPAEAAAGDAPVPVIASQPAEPALPPVGAAPPLPPADPVPAEPPAVDTPSVSEATPQPTSPPNPGEPHAS